MRAENRSNFPLALARTLMGLVIMLPLILASPVNAGVAGRTSLMEAGQTDQNAATGSVAQFNQPPVANDDSGPGFYTFKNSPFTTGNVLANDYDPDGDLLFVKTFDSSPTKGLVSYLPGGSLDTTFGTGGKVTTDLGGFYYAGPLAIQPDDKILVAGYVNIYTPQGPIDTDIALARYNPNGSLDTSFNTTGLVTTTFPSGDAWISALAIQPDGKILAAGGENIALHPNSYPVFALIRYNSDGSLDNTFGSNGRVTTDFGGGGCISNALTLQSDGKIIAAGWAYTGVPASDYHNFALARYNPDGSLDLSFGNNGRVISSFGNSSAGLSVALQSDDKIVVAGYSGNWPSSDFALARYNPDGSLDTSFHYSGLFTTKFTGDSWGRAVIIQPDGKILVAGDIKPYPSTYYTFGLARYNANSSLDTYFNGNGMVTTDLKQSAVGLSLVLQPDGKFLVAGNIYNGSEYDYALARYNPDGSLDTSFLGNGIVTTPFGDAYYLDSVGLQSDGKIVLAGSAIHTFVLARYNAGGTFRYDPNGKFDDLAPGQTAFDHFTYTVSDGVFTDTATVTITVAGPIQVFLPVMR